MQAGGPDVFPIASILRLHHLPTHPRHSTPGLVGLAQPLRELWGGCRKRAKAPRGCGLNLRTSDDLFRRSFKAPSFLSQAKEGLEVFRLRETPPASRTLLTRTGASALASGHLLLAWGETPGGLYSRNTHTSFSTLVAGEMSHTSALRTRRFRTLPCVSLELTAPESTA